MDFVIRIQRIRKKGKTSYQRKPIALITDPNEIRLDSIRKKEFRIIVLRKFHGLQEHTILGK